MSKHIRLIAATALCLSMTLISACALAAPKLKLTLPSKEIRGGADYNITINASDPGFVTVKLSQEGVHIATLAVDQEIHTKDNVLVVNATDDKGAIIAPGHHDRSVRRFFRRSLQGHEVQGAQDRRRRGRHNFLLRQCERHRVRR